MINEYVNRSIDKGFEDVCLIKEMEVFYLICIIKGMCYKWYTAS